MLTGIFILAFVAILGILSHRRSRLEEKIIKNVPLEDWLTILGLPLGLYMGWYLIIRNIVNRPFVSLAFYDDIDVLAVNSMFLVYGFVGNALHFNAKVLWRYLKKDKKSTVYRINEMFHGKLSHYLAFLNAIFIIFMLPILEINHPLRASLFNTYIQLLIIGGAVFGYAASKAFFYTNEWFGGYNKPLFLLSSALLTALILIFKLTGYSLGHYPVSIFVIAVFSSIITAFIIRQFFIFTRLGSRRRLKFMAKMLSV
jgi:hypothetical protein